MTCIFMPRIRPFHSAHSHILPNGTGLESINRTISAPSTPRVPIGLLSQHGEDFRENAHRTTCIRTRERRARNVAHPQMIMLMGVCLKGRFDSAQARDPTQLSAHHRHKMIPAFERFVVGIAIMPLDDFPKLPSIDRFEKLPKDAIHVLHARSFSVSRQPESIRFTLDLPGMRCGIVNHSRDSPALAGEGWGGGASAKRAGRVDSPFPHPPRFARRPPPQAGEVRIQLTVAP